MPRKAENGQKWSKTGQNTLESGRESKLGPKKAKMHQKLPKVSQMIKNSQIWSKLVQKNEKEVFIEQPRLHRVRLTSYRVSRKNSLLW